jgi:hypothetical protein
LDGDTEKFPVELVGVVLGVPELSPTDVLDPVAAVALLIGLAWPADPHPASRETQASKINNIHCFFIAVLLVFRS